MKKVMLISEVHPHNTQRVMFNPFDPVQQFQAQHYKNFSFTREELEQEFQSRVDKVFQKCAENQFQLVLRDHAQFDYMEHQTIHRDRPLIKTLEKKYEIKSVVTLRNPIEAYASLRQSFPRVQLSFDSYCERLNLFLDDYRDSSFFHYEDFVTDPDGVMKKICDKVGLEFDPEFRRKFYRIKLTGDSGRGKEEQEIKRLPLREFDERYRQEVMNSVHYKKIAHALGYPAAPQ